MRLFVHPFFVWLNMYTGLSHYGGAPQWRGQRRSRRTQERNYYILEDNLQKDFF